METEALTSLSPEQREARVRRIGGSDAAAAIGVSKWKTPVQLWLEKTGQVPEPDLSDKENVQWGILLEDVVANEYARRRGVKAHRVNTTQVDSEHDWMVCNVDRRIVGVREGLEVKTTAAWMQQEWGEEGTDEVPAMYLFQGIHCMRVMDYEAWNFAVLIGGNELRSYRIERNEKREQVLIELEQKFMEHVRTRTPPKPVEVEDVIRLYPNATGVKQATPAIMDALAKYINLGMREKEIKAERDAEKLIIAEFLGDKSELLDAVDPTITVATFRPSERASYVVKATKSRTMRVK